jgi:membrane protein
VGVVFYGLLGLFPAITAVVSLYGTVRERLHHQRTSSSSLGGILPSSAVDIVHEQIDPLTAKSDVKLGVGGRSA